MVWKVASKVANNVSGCVREFSWNVSTMEVDYWYKEKPIAAWIPGIYSKIIIYISLPFPCILAAFFIVPYIYISFIVWKDCLITVCSLHQSASQQYHKKLYYASAAELTWIL